MRERHGALQTGSHCQTCCMPHAENRPRGCRVRPISLGIHCRCLLPAVSLAFFVSCFVSSCFILVWSVPSCCCCHFKQSRQRRLQRCWDLLCRLPGGAVPLSLPFVYAFLSLPFEPRTHLELIVVATSFTGAWPTHSAVRLDAASGPCGMLANRGQLNRPNMFRFNINIDIWLRSFILLSSIARFIVLGQGFDKQCISPWRRRVCSVHCLASLGLVVN